MASSSNSPISRRNLLQLGAFTGLATALSPALRLDRMHATLAPDGSCDFPRPENAEEALDALIAGNDRWATFTQCHPHEDELRRTSVLPPPAGNGQTPFAAIISCSDSRVPPELVFDQGIGDLFVARVAGNVATGTLLESLYYGTDHLGAPLVFVLGHSDCGAVKAAVASFPSHKLEFVKLLFPAVEAARDIVGPPYPAAQVIPEATKQNVIRGVQALRADPDFADLRIAGGVYDLNTSQVNILIQ